jgi:hypothetical protein
MILPLLINATSVWGLSLVDWILLDGESGSALLSVISSIIGAGGLENVLTSPWTCDWDRLLILDSFNLLVRLLTLLKYFFFSFNS